MSERAALIYLYSGSFDGLLCCLNEILTTGEEPVDIVGGEQPPSLYAVRTVEESAGIAADFTRRIRKSISAEALRQVKLCFLSCSERKELLIFRFLRLGFQVGSSVTARLTHPDVEPLMKAVRYLGRETEAFRGFTRFSELEGVLVAEISPFNQVLPLLGPYFIDRMPDETLFIYDRTHRAYLFHAPGKKAVFGYLDSFLPNEPGERELACRALWRRFYDTVAIPQRFNPKCQKTHLPLRYRGDMTEFREDRGGAGNRRLKA